MGYIEIILHWYIEQLFCQSLENTNGIFVKYCIADEVFMINMSFVLYGLRMVIGSVPCQSMLHHHVIHDAEEVNKASQSLRL